MIEIKDDTKEKCQDCPMFSPENIDVDILEIEANKLVEIELGGYAY